MAAQWRGLAALTVFDVPSSPARSRLRRRLIVGVTAIAGLVFFRYGFVTIRVLGWSGWPLALLLCVLAAAAWQVALMFSRPSGTVVTHTSSTENAVAGDTPPKPDTPASS